MSVKYARRATSAPPLNPRDAVHWAIDRRYVSERAGRQIECYGWLDMGRGARDKAETQSSGMRTDEIREGLRPQATGRPSWLAATEGADPHAALRFLPLPDDFPLLSPLEAAALMRAAQTDPDLVYAADLIFSGAADFDALDDCRAALAQAGDEAAVAASATVERMSLWGGGAGSPDQWAIDIRLARGA